MFDGPSVNLPMYPHTQERTPEAVRLIQALRRSDGIILSTPCYHGSISGLLKNALDYAEDLAADAQPYFDGRAVGLIVCGHGWQSSSITLTALRSIVHALRGWPTPMGVAMNIAQGPAAAFDEKGHLTDEASARQIKIMVGQVVEFARMRMHHAAAKP
jgi:FMN reductase